MSPSDPQVSGGVGVRKGRLLAAVIACLGAAVSLGLLWGSDVPLGVPGEWTWERISAGPGDRADVWLGLLAAGMAAGVYLLFVAWGAARIERANAAGRGVWLGGLALGGFALILLLQGTPREPYGISKIGRVLYYPAISGYYYHARYQMPDLRSFLAGYEEFMAEGDVLHIGTHPPGLFVLHRGVQNLCRNESLTRFLLRTQPEPLRDTFDLISDRARRTPHPLLPLDRAALWLAGLLTQWLAALTVIPLYVLLRRTVHARAAWWTAALWPLLPAVLIFIPKSDLLYPFLGTAFLAAWLAGWERKSLLWCASAGGLLWVALCFSLAVLPVALLAGLYALGDRWLGVELPGRGRVRDDLACGAAVVAAFGVLTLIAGAAYQINLLNVWWLNYQNHAAFYEQFQRTWWKWFLVNPVETVLSIGWPVVWLGAAGGWSSLRESPDDSPDEGAAQSRRRRLTAAVVALVWGLLWVSGKNSGEVARLWIPFFPWALWLAAPAVESLAERTDSAPVGARARPIWFVFVLLQALVCLLTLARVYGFSLS